MKKRVILIRHGDDPPDDRVHTWLVGAGFEPVVRKPFAGEPIGELDGNVAGSVVYGGGFDAFDTGRHPFLRDEYRWIEACMAAGVPLLGICQGAQQIAHHLGAPVGPKPDGAGEFGYYRVDPVEGAGDFLPGPIHIAQSHFHAFGIPSGAERLASSDLFENQAMRHGARTYALQFHAEVTIEGFRRWQDASWARWGLPGSQTREEQDRLMLRHDAVQARWFYGFLARLFGRAGAGEGSG